MSSKEIAQFTKGAVLDATKPQSRIDAIAAIPEPLFRTPLATVGTSAWAASSC
ncbi:MAG: hypothetical protein IPK22_26170 [Verrucomicrobiaceae bacterium]|nr:hypothetical protein [Verrucomicrobiaceae bacterium]